LGQETCPGHPRITRFIEEITWHAPCSTRGMRSANAKLRPMTEMTLEEWADLPEDEEGELVDGRLEEEEVPSFIHEEVVMWLAMALRAWLLPIGGWVFGSEAKYAVRKRSGRKPDVAVYLPGRRPEGANLARNPPDIVAEVITPRARDRRRDRIEKAADYAAFGVKVYVLVDPEARSLEAFELVKGKWVATVSHSKGKVTLPLCKGLVLDLDALWKRIDILED
jgi:Uma2 family endonuclease